MNSGFTGNNMHSRSSPWCISVVVLFVEAMITIENMHEQELYGQTHQKIHKNSHKHTRKMPNLYNIDERE